MADEQVNGEHDDGEELDEVSEVIAALLASLVGAVLIRAVNEPKPVENGIARLVRELRAETGEPFSLYQMDPPFANHEHVLASLCKNGCCAHIVPVHADDDWEFGFRPCGGHEGMEAWTHATEVTNSSLAACFARYGYTVAEEA